MSSSLKVEQVHPFQLVQSTITKINGVGDQPAMLNSPISVGCHSDVQVPILILPRESIFTHTRKGKKTN